MGIRETDSKGNKEDYEREIGKTDQRHRRETDQRDIEENQTEWTLERRKRRHDIE